MRFFILLTLVLTSFLVSSQVTTSTLEGSVVDQKGEAVIGAKISLTHQETNTVLRQLSADDGSYLFTALTPGGPYLLEVKALSFESQSIVIPELLLGQMFELNVDMSPVTQDIGPVEVKAKKVDPLAVKNGIATTIDQDQINKLPTLNRSLQDVTKLSPQGGANSFGGTNYRYNNLSIDGASNNDALGFQEPASGAAGSVASGTPGSLAGTQPIALDAISQVQVSLTPYDVKQGNFTGANINAVTRSGTNTLEGSAYVYGRNHLLTGRSIDENRTRLDGFTDYIAGARLGGPLIKDKLFGFISFENALRDEPVPFAAGDPESQIGADIAQQVVDTLMSRYNYDPGTYGVANNVRQSNKIFARLDYHVSENLQLTLRNNTVLASANTLERNANLLTFGSQGFTHHSMTNGTVFEMKQRLKNRMSNHLIAGVNIVNDFRDYSGRVFPHIDIKYNTVNTILLGTYREASIYGLGLHTYQLSDNFNIYRKKHKITIGTNNELYDIEYRFLTAWNGRWEYKSLDNFFNNTPSRIRGVYNTENNDFEYNRNTPSADFLVALISAYAQDEWKVNKRFSLTYGLRMDLQWVPYAFPVNESFKNTPEFAHYNNRLAPIPDINPRLSFRYVLDKKEQQSLRGGTGLFTGRIPFAWYAYGYYISGTTYGNIDYKPSGSFLIEEDLSQLAALQPNLTEVNIIDNNFRLPRQWRSSLSYEYKFGSDWTLGASALYSKSLREIQIKSINLKDETARFNGADDREYYVNSGDAKKINPNFTNVFLLTNTSMGYAYNFTLSLSKKFDFGLNANLAYNYGESKDVSNGVRNSLAANFNRNQSINSNNPDLAHSNFDIRHRIISNMDYSIELGNGRFTAGALFTAASGTPFSFIYLGDLNNDGASRNDLIYVPGNSSEIAFDPILDGAGNIVVTPEEQWQQLDSYITNDAYLSTRRGNYAERNGARTPWNGQLDLHLAYEFNYHKKKKGRTIVVTLDIINFTNLINRNWGRLSFVPNSTNLSYQLIELERIDNGTPYFTFNNPESDPWQVDQLNSRWQAQLGLRVNI